MAGYRRALHDDPFGYLRELRRTEAPAPGEPAALLRLPWGGWCVSDPALAHELLRAEEFNADRSGFFGELLPTRADQIEVGHAVRNLLRSRLPDYRTALAGQLARLPAASRWPDAATELVHRSLADQLLHPATPARARRLTDRAVHGGVVFEAPTVWRRARAEALRARFIAAIAEQVRDRRADPAAEPRDVLDAVIGGCPAELPDRTVAEVFLVMFRSIVAPVAGTLAWSVFLAGTHHTGDGELPWPADWIVREAMRHRPMVWMVGRSLPDSGEFGGVPFHAGDLLSVSPYLLHHDDRGWTDHDEFRPGRWADAQPRGPYIPFGAGPFACAGASVAMVLLTEALTALTQDHRITVSGGDPRPVMVEGAIPRPFTVHRTVRHASREVRR
ncbi:cytochrome P450 [Kitasatospora viridis]|uniref:Cytochrome P450 n=1 Tax=Kitasatospora viridis TaxID=281105 RepID=A0A561S9M2_9ACTN|nr:cytochrome P450 [Kitasatospora viridis]TWF71505.1 cytochrome P450 [Kitasatospora viridis]